MKKLRCALCLLLCAAFLLSFAACKKDKKVETTPTVGVEKVAHTVRILNQGDMPLEKVGVYIYEDSTMAELVWYDVTNADGEMTFTDVTRDTYVAVLADVPTGYEVEEYYPLTGEVTEIRLAAGVMAEDEIVTYKLGDMVMDFTVTATDGKEYSLSSLMEGKQAVILNFYYNGCVPCQMEFPYLQEAYEEYKDKIAVLAMNPIDDNEAVAQFRKTHKLSFLMASCDIKWEEIMQITAYPTTVVIDRYGNIVLMHKGGVESAQIFKDVFAAVTGKDYKQKIYKSISDVPSTAPIDPYENPTEMSATEKFEVTLEGGKEHTIQFYRLNKLIMTVKDKDAYVIYNGQKYTPKNGVITLVVSTPDMNTPVAITFGNSSNQLKKLTVTMMSQKGTLDNPYKLVIGENQVKISAGNEQGVYYVWTATDNGTLRAWCTSATPGVKYDCTLYNTASMAVRNLSADSTADENSRNVVSVQVNKGDKIQMIASVMPDDKWNYPAGNFTYMVEFVSGEGRKDTEADTTTYTVTVTDKDGNPMSNVNFHTLVEEKATPFATKDNGVASIKLPTGTYKVTMIVPEGYTSEVTEFTLTPEAPDYTVKLAPKVIVMVDYTVLVQSPAGEPVAGATVTLGELFAVTGADGKAVFRLEEGQYTASILAPEGFLTPEENAFVLGQETSVTVSLAYVPGTVNAPIDVEAYPYTTQKIAPGKTVYHKLHNANGMVLTVKDAVAGLIIGDTTYNPDADGNVIVTLPGGSEPVVVQIANNGEAQKTFKLSLSHTVGHETNPQPLENLGQLETVLNKNDYYYRWKTAEEGVVTFYVVSATEGVTYDVILTNITNGRVRKLSVDGNAGLVSLNVAANDDVSIQITVIDSGTVTEPATVVSTGSFTAQENTEDAKQTYSVIVQDQEGNAMPGVSLTIGNTNLTTDANGLAFAQLVEGSYTATILLPEGFKTETAQFVLTVDAPQKTVTLLPEVKLDYTVNVLKNSAAYTGNVTVQIFKGEQMVYEAPTTTGQVVANLPEGDYTVQLVLEDTLVEYDPEGCNLSTAAPTVNIPLSDVILYSDYTVKVENANGVPQSGILVQIQQNGNTVANGTTNSAGTMTANLPQDRYTVVLSFAAGTDCYYNKGNATLAVDKTQTTIVLANEVNTAKYTTHWCVGDSKIYVLEEGYTHVQVGAEKAYYYADGNDCMFEFRPGQVGVFRISVDNPNVEITLYGSVVMNPFERASQNEDNACYFTVSDSTQLGNVTQLMGVEVVSGVTDLGITITRVGDPGFNVNTAPTSTGWQTGPTPTKKITLGSGLSFTYIDIYAPANTYNIVYSATDGYYHVGSATGPVLYINLGTKDTTSIPYALNSIIHGSGNQGGSGIKKFFYDENGQFVKKEDYTELIDAYISCADDTYGMHPVTKDMVYMLKNGTDEWWDPNVPEYSAGFAIEGCTVELGWMFACCYIG